MQLACCTWSDYAHVTLHTSASACFEDWSCRFLMCILVIAVSVYFSICFYTVPLSHGWLNTTCMYWDAKLGFLDSEVLTLLRFLSEDSWVGGGAEGTICKVYWLTVSGYRCHSTPLAWNDQIHPQGSDLGLGAGQVMHLGTLFYFDSGLLPTHPDNIYRTVLVDWAWNTKLLIYCCPHSRHWLSAHPCLCLL